jgi:hypothetical protein
MKGKMASSANLPGQIKASRKEISELLERALRVLGKDPGNKKSKVARKCLRLIKARLKSLT